VAVIPLARPQAMMLPVEVPAKKSKQLVRVCSGLIFLSSFSSVTYKVAVSIPRIPPPSKLKILKFFEFSMIDFSNLVSYKIVSVGWVRGA
jgi:hypothetical protein